MAKEKGRIKITIPYSIWFTVYLACQCEAVVLLLARLAREQAGPICTVMCLRNTRGGAELEQMRELGLVVTVAFLFLPMSSNYCPRSQHTWAASIKKQ